jgi:adenylylsulfate kinase
MSQGVLAPPDPAWAEAFREAAETVAGALGWPCCAVHHVGSTAVPGVPARPEIDMLVVIRRDAARRSADRALRALGYKVSAAASGVYERRHAGLWYGVRLAAVGDPLIDRCLALRDDLRAHAAVAAAYGRAKHVWAQNPARYPFHKRSWLDARQAVAQAWWARVPVLVMSGPVGVGKTTVAEAVAEALAARGVARLFVDLDALTEMWPRTPGDPFAWGLASAALGGLWAVARASGARALVAAQVVERESDRTALADAVPGADVRIVRLEASPECLARRLQSRHPPGPALDWHWRRARTLQSQLARSGPSDLVMDTTDLSPDAVAAAILDRLEETLRL